MQSSEFVILQNLINENSVFKLPSRERQSLQYNEKELREAAAAEVISSVLVTGSTEEVPSKKRKSLNADEKAKHSRDRNREHAKNTRLRKKAYILKLQELVDAFRVQISSEEEERRLLGERILNTYTARKNAALMYLTLRSTNVRERTKWEMIFEENVTCTLPITPYRYFHRAEIKNGTRCLIGIDSLITDTISLSVMLETLNSGSVNWKQSMLSGETCKIIYHTSKEDVIASNDMVMCRFILKLEKKENLSQNFIQPGMLHCKFSRFNKIISMEIIFDVMSFMQQLQRMAEISLENSIIPNTLDMAVQPSNEARLLVQSEFPYSILHVNISWTKLFGYSQGDLESGQLLSTLDLSSSEMDTLVTSLENCKIGRPGSCIVRARTKLGACRDCVYLKTLPLTSDTDKVSHILIVANSLS